MSFRIEVRHPSLERVRVVEGLDPYLVQQEALAQLETWERLWERSQGDSAPEHRGLRDTAPLDGSEVAQALTARAQHEIRRLGGLLSAPIPLGLDPGAEEPAFPEPPPEPPPLPDPVPRPSPDQDRFRPRLRLVDRILPPLGRKRNAEARERYQRALKAWEREEERVRRALEAHQDAFEAWDGRRRDFEAERRAATGPIRRTQGTAQGRPREELADKLHRLLLAAHDPAFVPPDYRVEFEGPAGRLHVVQRLPSPTEIPTLERVVFRPEHGDFLEEHLSPQDQARAFDSVAYQSMLRTLRVVFESDVGESLNVVKVDGWVRCRLPATGRPARLALLSLQTTREQVQTLDLKRIQPKACFDGLGGRRAGDPHELKALEGTERTVPSSRWESRLGKEDSPLDRAGPGLKRSAQPETDLDALTPAEFRSLMMGILRAEYSGDTGEIFLTVTERDGSLEAVTRPAGADTRGRGGVVIHVRRDRTPLGAGPAQELLRRVEAEGAAGGVLLTLGELAPGTLDALEGRSLRILDGLAVQRLVTRYLPRTQPNVPGPSDGMELPGLATPQ